MTYKLVSGGMIGTAEDMVRFGVSLLGGGLLQPGMMEEMFESRPEVGQRFHEDGPPTALRCRQALIWRIRSDEEGRDYVHHCGAVKGFATCLVLYPDEGLVAAVAANAYGLNLEAARIFVDFFREGGGLGPSGPE